MNLGTARMLRRLAKAGAPLSRHALQMGTCGCKAADIHKALSDGLVELVPGAPGIPGKRGRRPFPLVQLRGEGLVALATFAFPRTGRPGVRRTDRGMDWVSE